MASNDDQNLIVRRRLKELEIRADQSTYQDYQLIMGEANDVLKDVSRAQEAGMDYRIFHKMVRKNRENIDKQRGGPFESSQFLLKLGGKYFSIKDDGAFETKGQTRKWVALGDKYLHLGKKTKHLEFTNGSFDKRFEEGETPSKKARKPAVKNTGPLVATKYTIQTAETAKENGSKGPSVSEQVKKVRKKLTKLSKISDVNFYNFVIDPESFSNTIKHIFLTSFLVKDNEACIYIKNELPYIRATRHTEDGKRQKDASQMILTITEKQWKELKELLKIKESVINLEE